MTGAITPHLHQKSSSTVFTLFFPNPCVHRGHWQDGANDHGGVVTSKILSCDWSMRLSLIILVGTHWSNKVILQPLLKPGWRQVLHYKHTETVQLGHAKCVCGSKNVRIGGALIFKFLRDPVF